MLSAITWDINPIAIDLGFWQIRWYGICFAATIYTCFGVWRANAMKYGNDDEYAERFLWYGVLAVVFGSRVGHCLFYEPERYLANPIEILYFWKGGLASHGATIGLFIAVWLFGRNNKTPFVKVADFLVQGIALAAGGVRIGNFFNSEIVGRAWDGPWAVIFTRYDAAMGVNPPIARHPTAIYEFLMGLVTFIVLKWVEKRKIRNAGSGLQMGIFLILYFSFRFTVEFFKEYQVDRFIARAEQIRQGAEGFQLTMGQYLSILPVLVGVFFLVRALRQPKDAWPEPSPWQPPAAATPTKSSPHRKKKRK